MQSIVKGYVLRLVPYQDNNAIVDVLTEDGFVSFKARGVLRTSSKLAACVQPYTYGEYQLNYKNESGYRTLESGSVIKILPSLFTDLRCSIVLALLVETIFKFKDAENWYDIFNKIFNHLLSENNFATIVLILLKYNTIYSGSYLGADECVFCGSHKDLVTVSFSDGGFICKTCNHNVNKPIKSHDYLVNFRYVIKASYDNIGDFIIPSSVAKELSIDFFNHLYTMSGLTFKCRELVLDCL